MQLIVKGFLVVFGMAIIGLGYFIGVHLASQARTQAELAESLPAVGAASLAASTPNTPILVEGVISPNNPTPFRDFVAYVRQEFRGADQNGDEKWEEDERVTPRLWLEAAGPVRLANSDYAIEGPHQRWQEEGLNWNRRSQEGSKRYFGLVAGEPAIALGAVSAGAAGNELRAALVYGGTREQYIAAQRASLGWMQPVGLAVALAGGGLILFATWGLRRWR
ncbi:MAG: hypothetical protein AB4911_12010 [Oscillochloridaceae bacterium umkhey_bin13]